MRTILIGNSFPLSQVESTVTIEVVEIEVFREALCNARVCSFWGHTNTLQAASEFAGCDLTPHSERPVLTLSERKRPVLCGLEFNVCWVLSPRHALNFRPAIGAEVGSELITGWMIKKMEWI
ncbi:MAG: hypothetical protein WC340_03605 [Kiritimatiellia bacterium]